MPTNLYTGFFLTRAAAKIMPPGGSIIFTVSDVVFNTTNGIIDYAASKYAVASFVQRLGISLAAKGFRVDGVAPGIVYTPLLPASGSTNEQLRQICSAVTIEEDCAAY